jgi:hypothetical protein
LLLFAVESIVKLLNMPILVDFKLGEGYLGWGIID